MTLISKGAGVCGLASCFKDIHKTALIYSKNEYAKAMSDALIRTDLNTQKTNRLSYKDTQIKKWLLKNNFFAGIKETYGAVKGYVKGVFNAGIRYIPNITCSVIALCANKSKTLANTAAIALGVMEIFDFIKNSTTIGKRNDYLK